MGTQRQVHRPFACVLPPDFAERLVRFKKASGLTWRMLARLLGVSPYRIRQWRKRGVAPSPAHLFMLLTIAEVMGLRDGILMLPAQDLPDGREWKALRS